MPFFLPAVAPLIKIMLDAHHVNAAHWTEEGRYTITLERESGTQWLFEQLPCICSPELIGYEPE
jgi:hypothetical protein